MARKLQYSQTFVIRPQSKQRPRMTRTGRTYTPKQTVEFEAKIASMYKGPLFNKDTHLRVGLKFSLENIEITIEEILPNPIKSKLRGDIDNYAKSVLDALNGIAYEDDKQITMLGLEKL